MIDFGQSKEFLASLSNVSHLHFQIWDADEGLVFSSGPDEPAEPAPEELESFVEERHSIFRSSLDDEDMMFTLAAEEGAIEVAPLEVVVEESISSETVFESSDGVETMMAFVPRNGSPSSLTGSITAFSRIEGIIFSIILLLKNCNYIFSIKIA